ncbi:unnamed protein product [Rotaria sp. Silwood2]|nr:unnamed protein product [Rotaria sp. Silwood2]CAF4354679.1 unnamed protein product [Rotaria sp. Silwood2]CAF4402897.1 unnamed protein product [Rotaria sp. Silwood2]
MKSEIDSTSTHAFRKWFGVIWLFIEVNITAANIFGFAALFEVLPKYGIFGEYCHSVEAVNSTELDCSQQTQKYQDALNLGIIFFNMPSIFIGIIIDAFGCRFMKLIGV